MVNVPAKETANETKMKGKRCSDLCTYLSGRDRHFPLRRLPVTSHSLLVSLAICHGEIWQDSSGMTNLLPAYANSLEFSKSRFTSLPGLSLMADFWAGLPNKVDADPGQQFFRKQLMRRA